MSVEICVLSEREVRDFKLRGIRPNHRGHVHVKRAQAEEMVRGEKPTHKWHGPDRRQIAPIERIRRPSAKACWRAKHSGHWEGGPQARVMQFIS